MWQQSSARDVAVRMLRALFDDERPGAELAGPLAESIGLLPFQTAAVARARAIIERYGGVVVADSVGLGKTFVALGLLAHTLADGGRAGVIVPASLRPQWRAALQRLSRDDRATGDLAPGHAPAPGTAAPDPTARVRLVTHAALSRGTHPAAWLADTALLVIDEAHRFRNPGARRHAALARLAAGGEAVPPALVFLTASPVNNHPADLYHLIRLFARDDAFRTVGVPSLAEAFGAAPAGGPRGRAPADAAAVRRVIGEVMIRRTRETLATAALAPAAPSPASARFPERLPPRLVHYDGRALRDAARTIGSLELRAHAAAADGGGTGDAAAALLRLGLLKRLESGRAAAAISIRRHLSFLRAFGAAAREGRLLRAGRDARAGGGDADPAQLLLLGVVADDPPPGVDLDALLASAQRDRAALEGALEILAGPDPKIERCRALVQELARERVLVFTEYRDTAAALWRDLAPHVRTARVDGAGAWLGLRPASRAAVLARFAPRARGRPEPQARERVDVLVATEVLGEGVDLQDARHVVCYDLPWNPVRLLQRIGRVDRLGSPHRQVAPHLFVPDRGLDALLGLTRRLRHKLEGIAGTVGADGALDLLDSLGHGEEAVDAALERLARRGRGDVMEALRAELAGLGADEGEAVRAGVPVGSGAGRRTNDQRAGGLQAASKRQPTLPSGACVAARVATPTSVVLVRTPSRTWLLEAVDGPAGFELRDAGPAAVETIRSALADKDPGGGVPPGELRALERAAFDFRAAVDAAGRAPARVPATSPAARLAHRIRTLVEAEGAAAGPGTLARADTLLARLGRPLGPAEEARVRELLEATPRTACLGEWVSAAEISLGENAPIPADRSAASGKALGHPGADPAPSRAGRSPRILALIATPPGRRPSG